MCCTVILPVPVWALLPEIDDEKHGETQVIEGLTFAEAEQLGGIIIEEEES